jgi:hypothetical protein
MSELGQSRRFDHAPTTSGLPRQTDILSVRRHVSNVVSVNGINLAYRVQDAGPPLVLIMGLSTEFWRLAARI